MMLINYFLLLKMYLRQYYRLDNSDDERSLSDILEFNENVDEDLHNLHGDGE